MRIDILTVVPELLVSPLNESILKRAQKKGLVRGHVHNTGITPMTNTIRWMTIRLAVRPEW